MGNFAGQSLSPFVLLGLAGPGLGQVR